MRKKASGFYADSLEMLLDTMCNVLGGILFITLALAVITRDSSTPESIQRQTEQLNSELAALTSSNSTVAAKIQYALLQLQAPPQTTNLMRLPKVSQTSKKAWNVMVRYGRVYPLFAPPLAGQPLEKNTQTLDWRPGSVEPRIGQGGDPTTGMQAMTRYFQESSQTNYFFAFWVYADSFAAFNQAKEVVFNSGMDYGWEPRADNKPLPLNGRGPGIQPQK